MKSHLFGSLCLLLSMLRADAQTNPLYIPPVLSGTTVNLTLQNATRVFYTGFNTQTMEYNGGKLGPTLVLQKGDSVTLNVTNSLTGGAQTSAHWHGLHVAPQDDGGPHTPIASGATWSPHFKVFDRAASYWYHPHLHGSTDEQATKGAAGLLIVKDSAEAALNLPRTYGVDDFPIAVQAKAFDATKQFVLNSALDSVILVNGTKNPTLAIPAQVVRLRLLNGSSERTYLFGFQGNKTFYQIATDGGLRTAPLALTRLRLAPGERAEIIVNFTGQQGQTSALMSFASELPNGIWGAASVGGGMGGGIPNYSNNALNGANFTVLPLTIASATANPVTTVPASLVTVTGYNASNSVVSRTFTFTAQGGMMNVNGPFLINGATYNMNTMNHTSITPDQETWTLTNNTGIAHPFHVHGAQFWVTSVGGATPPAEQQGWKDVVLVPNNSSAVFLVKWERFSHPTIPYMYHCHLLNHEDDGMMGQFLVAARTVTVGAISPTSFCPPATLNVPFTVSHAFYAGNQFKAQLSGANGSFSNPTVIGTLTGTGSGSISATIPANTPPGTGYKIRVVGTAPTVNSSPNVSNLTIACAAPTLTVGSIAGSPFCQGEAVVVPFVVSGNLFNPGNTFTAQLSDANGNFSNPTNIGTLAGTNSGSIAATIPAAAPLGTGYRIRVVASDPAATSAPNASDLQVGCGTPVLTVGSIAGSPFCQGAAVVVPFVVSGNLFNLGNIFTAQLSDANGNFSNPTNIGTLASTNSGSIAATIPAAAPLGTGYRIRVVASDPAATSAPNASDLQVGCGTPVLTVGSIAGSPFCAGEMVNVPFSVAGNLFNPSNIFTAQLSNKSGSFAAPVNIGTLAGTNSGNIAATLPVNTAYGTKYRIRVTASNPTATSAANTSNLTIGCATPVGLTAGNVTPTSAVISWTFNECPVGYQLQRRVLGTTAWTTLTLNTNTTSSALNNLLPGTTYQYRLRAKCNASPAVYSAYTAIKTFATPSNLINTGSNRLEADERGSQSQRLVLMEEFTGENCPPCGWNNPAFNQLLDSHAGKIVSIKYQTDIPFGSPPLFSYNKPEVNAASSYYDISSAPTGYMDGNVWSGGVSDFTNTHINDRYAVPSPFEIKTTHTFSAAKDEIHTHTVIRASENLNGMNQLKAKIAVTEKEINAPATLNGETNWKHVMRKLLPAFGGIALPADWAVGDSVVIEESWVIAQPPSPSAGKLPDWMQLEVVAFVQNEATKEVMQAGFSPSLVTTGATNVLLDEPLVVFPSPATDEIQVLMPGFWGTTFWEIFSADGKTVLKGTFSGAFNLEKINVGRLPSGIYLLNVRGSAGVRVEKFIKN